MNWREKIDAEIVDAAINGKISEIGDVVIYIGGNPSLSGVWQIDDDGDEDAWVCFRRDGSDFEIVEIPPEDVSRAIPEHLRKRIEIAVNNS